MELKNFFAQDDQGNKLPGATCYVYLRGTESLAPGLLAANGLPLNNPFIADQQGLIQFATPNGLYDVRVVSGDRDNRIHVQFNDVSEDLAAANSAADRAENAVKSGVVLFDTYAQASAETLLEGQEVEVFVDETRANNVSRYRMESGQLVYKPYSYLTLEERLKDRTSLYNGAGMIDFLRGPFARSSFTVAGFLSAQTLNVWEFMDRIPSSDKVNEAEPASWYWDMAINAALQNGKKVVIPYMLKVKRKVSFSVTGAQLVGDGIDSAGLVLDPVDGLGHGFVGDCVVELGDSSLTANVSTHLGISSLTIDVGGRNIPGVAMFGARDGSYAKRVYIKNFSATAFKTNKAGSGSGMATGKMCQGVKIEQVIALPQHGIKADVFLLDGIFESEVNLCKAFGYTLAENSAVGFAVGRNTESRGLKLNTCSAANMVKLGNNANFNCAIQYGEWARDNWDYNTTFENVEGGGVVFHGGTASGQLLPLNCRSVDPRPYFSALAAVLNPLYLFRKANACYAEGVNYYSTVKAIFEFTDEGGINNYGLLVGGVNPDNLVSSGNVVFRPGALSSNFVAGYSSAVSTRKEFVVTVDQQFYRVLPNGSSEQTDPFWTTFNLGAPGQYRWRNNSLETVASIDGKGLTSGQTALSLMLIKSEVPSFDRLEVGPPNSAGTNYRAIRVPN